MTRTVTLLLALALLSACSTDDGSNPFDPDPAAPAPDPNAGNGGQPTAPVGDDSRQLPPGTPNPTPSTSIVRYEQRDDNGNGFIEAPRYVASSDSFYIDNLPFDGDNTYARDNSVGSLGPAGGQGPFAVYENDETVTDPVSGAVIDQLAHKVIFQRSASGLTEVVLVRVSDYQNYGFGGWAYQRNGDVTLPDTLQATFTGDYAALRDFDSRTGLEYATGVIRLDVDWDDFNGDFEQDAIKGTVTNRRIFDMDGNDVTRAWLDALEDEAERPFSDLPDIRLVISNNTIDSNGEITAQVFSNYVDDSGEVQAYEGGTLNAILAGDNPDEIVGTLVVESSDLILGNGNVRETGGFIAQR
jgi:hypothetical protein